MRPVAAPKPPGRSARRPDHRPPLSDPVAERTLTFPGPVSRARTLAPQHADPGDPCFRSTPTERSGAPLYDRTGPVTAGSFTRGARHRRVPGVGRGCRGVPWRTCPPCSGPTTTPPTSTPPTRRCSVRDNGPGTCGSDAPAGCSRRSSPQYSNNGSKASRRFGPGGCWSPGSARPARLAVMRVPPSARPGRPSVLGFHRANVDPGRMRTLLGCAARGSPGTTRFPPARGTDGASAAAADVTARRGGVDRASGPAGLR